MKTESNVWPPAPDCPPPQPQARPPWWRVRLFLPAGLLGLGFSALGWVILAHGLMFHVPPAQYYRYLLPLAVVGMGASNRTTRMEDAAKISSSLLFLVAALMMILHVAHYF